MRALLCAALLAGAPLPAAAYPQFQLSTGAVRCTQCHQAPAGGGLLTGYGRGESADTISWGGDGRFLHGAWEPPSWLRIGGDVRVAGLVHDEEARAGADVAVFPMQADLNLRAGGRRLAVFASVGYRGSTRSVNQSFASRLISREHYVLLRQGPVGWYVRAGRFFAPYGLRLAEHTAFVRRFLGFNLLEETYNVSGGYLDDRWELHVTAFMPDFWRDEVGQPGAGGAVYVERRLGGRAAAALQAKVTAGDRETRPTAGAVGKLYLPGPRLELLAEADALYQTFHDVDAPRAQLLAHLDVAWFPARGVMARLMLERYDEDLAVPAVARSAAGLQLHWFPTAHVEATLLGRLVMFGAGDDGPLVKTLLLQAHYYL